MKILLELKKYLDMVLTLLGLKKTKVVSAPVIQDKPKKKKRYYKPQPKKNS